MHYIQGLSQLSLEERRSSLCVQQRTCRRESFDAACMGDEETSHEWSIRRHSLKCQLGIKFLSLFSTRNTIRSQ